MAKASVDSSQQRTKLRTWFSCAQRTRPATAETARTKWASPQWRLTVAISTFRRASSSTRQRTIALRTASAATPSLTWTKKATKWWRCSKNRRKNRAQADPCSLTLCCQVWRTSRPPAPTTKPHSTLYSEQQTKEALCAPETFHLLENHSSLSNIDYLSLKFWSSVNGLESPE